MSKDNQKYVKTLAKVCQKKTYLTALKYVNNIKKYVTTYGVCPVYKNI